MLHRLAAEFVRARVMGKDNGKKCCFARIYSANNSKYFKYFCVQKTNTLDDCKFKSNKTPCKRLLEISSTVLVELCGQQCNTSET